MTISRVLLAAAAVMLLSSGLAPSARAQTTPLRERRLAPAEVGKKIRSLKDSPAIKFAGVIDKTGKFYFFYLSSAEYTGAGTVIVSAGATVTSADVGGEDSNAIASDMQEHLEAYETDNPPQPSEPGNAQWSRTVTTWKTNNSKVTIKGSTKRILKPQAFEVKWIFWP